MKLTVFFVSLLTVSQATVASEALPWVEVADDRQGFVLRPSGLTFVPWGVNYDHDQEGHLLEDYWENDWPRVEQDFGEIRKLGANVVRVHLQLAKFMDGPDQPNPKALDRLRKLVDLAERQRLYLDLTGLGCYHKQDVPAWYDELDEAGRWQVQARFWESIARRIVDSPAIFCCDLMNEPVVPGGRRDPGAWLGPAFAGKHFVQFITLDARDRSRLEVAQAWIRQLTGAIRGVDRRHLITVDLVDWSLDRPGLTSGFVPQKIAADLDFISVHLYPESGKFDAARETLKGFAVGKPVVVEETFPLRCTPAELDEFIHSTNDQAAGWISFYWGTPVEKLRDSKTLGDAIMREWLEKFSQRAGIR